MLDPRLKSTILPYFIEDEAWNQIMNTLNIDPLICLSIMPDVHTGYDLPIGGVALIQNYIWPGAVGYDIGCGMCHINTHKTQKDLNIQSLENIFNKILSKIPVGFNSRNQDIHTPQEFPNASNSKEVEKKVNEKMCKQLGTLGGGNHFIEIGVNKFNEIGITIHSGSRNPGHTIGGYYMNLAKKEGTKFGKGLGLFHIESEFGKAYYTDMLWAQDYALQNRKIMLNEVLECIGIHNYNTADFINENHNHAVIQNNNVLHRKGATPAEKDQLGIIPSNQRDGVYISRGLGNKEYLSSASHGAGRCKSRKKAKKDINIQDFKKQMEGIICKINENVIDEAPDAYKNINEVLAAQDGILVDIIDHFRPIIVIKG